MNLKMSFCNKSLIKSDLKRFWWIAALHTVILFFTGTMNVLNDVHSNYIGYYDGMAHGSYSSTYIYSHFGIPACVLGCMAPVVLGVMLFSYLNSTKSTCAMHSLPVTRKTHYVSHYISGVVLMALPVIINSLVLLVLMSGNGFENWMLADIGKSILVAMLYSVLTFSGACAVAQICANAVASLILTYGFGLLPLFAELYVNYLLDRNLFGYIPNNNYSVSMFLYKIPLDLLKIQWALMYVGISLAFAVGGYWIYKFRKAEKTAEVLAFDVLKPLFVVAIGIYAGGFGYAYFDGVWSINNMFIMIPTGLLGVIIAQMLVKKSLKPEGVWKNALVYTAICLVMIGVFKLDFAGYQGRVPRADDVKYAVFEPGVNTNRNECYHMKDGKKLYYDKIIDNKLTDPKDIQNVIALHKQIVKQRKANGYRDVQFEYKLKNGKTLKRSYRIAYEDYAELFKPVAENDTVRSAYFPILADDGRRIVEIYMDKNESSYEIQDKQRLIDALKEDLKNASADEYADENYTEYVIRMNFQKPCHYEDGTKVTNNDFLESEVYIIRPSYQNTIAVLNELGIQTQIEEQIQIEE